MPPSNRPKPSAIEDVWDETQIEKALKRLDMLHTKSRHLRTTIPRMMKPITDCKNTRTMLPSFVQACKDANKEVQDFKDLMNEPETKKVLEHAKRSRRDDPKGIAPYNPTEHAEWFKLEN